MNDFAPTATVLTDSISTETGHRLTTLELNLHPDTLAPLLAHRAFSRTVNYNAKLSYSAQIKALDQHRIYPALWTSDNGSTGATPLHHLRTRAAREAWDDAREDAIAHAFSLAELGVHRSIINRILAPFLAVTAIVTATDWADFFEQRLAIQDPNDPLIDTEITGLALVMRDAIERSQPEKLQPGHWHLPRLDSWDVQHLELTQAIRASAARCATGTSDTRFDRDTYQWLFMANPPHWSPLEHIATPAATTDRVAGNYTGWHQLRHLDPRRFA